MSSLYYIEWVAGEWGGVGGLWEKGNKIIPGMDI